MICNLLEILCHQLAEEDLVELILINFACLMDKFEFLKILQEQTQENLRRWMNK
jgi:hypothetical protein